MTAVPVPRASGRPRPLLSLAVYYRLLLRTQVSIPRLLGIGGLGALALLLGIFGRADDDPAQAATDIVDGYGLGVLVPLATLWLGTSALGDLVEDRLLAYLRLKPVASWQLPAAAALATLTIVLPLTALPLTVATLIAGAGDVAPAAFLASAFAALAYAGVFVAAGLWFRRAVWWGLAFVVVWENVISHVAEGAARFTVSGWASSVLSLAPDVTPEREAGPVWAGFVVLTLIAVAGWLIATWRYRRQDID